MVKRLVLFSFVVAVLLAGCIGGQDVDSSTGGQVQKAEESGIPPDASPIMLPTGDNIQFVNINITSDGVTPVNASGQPREIVRWRNTNGFSVYLSLARTLENRTIAAGGSASLLLNGQTSYKVYRNDTDEFIAEGTVAIR